MVLLHFCRCVFYSDGSVITFERVERLDGK